MPNTSDTPAIEQRAVNDGRGKYPALRLTIAYDSVSKREPSSVVVATQFYLCRLMEPLSALRQFSSNLREWTVS
jgi:hypothetical protein